MRVSYRTAQTFILLAVLLLSALLVGGSAYYNARFGIEDLATQVLEQSSERVRQYVDDVLQVAVGQGETHQELFERGVLDVEDHEVSTKYFLAALRGQPSLSYLSLGLQDGRYWHVYRDQDGRISVQWLLPNATGGFDLTDYAPRKDGTLEETFRDRDTKRTPPYERPYYRAAKSAGTSVWPETYIFLGEAGKLDIPGVTRATPVRNDVGETLGVATADFDLFALSRYLERLKIGEEGFAFLMELRADGSRRVIAHPDAPERLKLTAPAEGAAGRQALPAERVDDPCVRGLLSQIPSSLIDYAPELTSVRFDADGVAYLGAYRALESGDRPTWVVALCVPESEVLARIQSMNRTTIAIALGGVLLILLLGLLISQPVSERLQAIVAETSAVAKFRLTPKPPERSRIREVDQLGLAVEEMKSGLRSFGKYVPTDLVRSILESGHEATLGGDRRRIAIYFSDVADFTSIAESLEPEKLVELLSSYLGVMTQEMLDAGATVDKYIGDAIMAFWGAPYAHEDPCWAACRTALANQRALAALRARWLERGLPELRARIGLNVGDAIVGNFGAEDRLDYTAVGDTVNLAARLEGLNKVYDTGILMSAAVHEEVADRVIARRVDRVAVKGRTGGTLVYELVGLPEEVPAETHRFLEAYEGALDHYFARRFQETIQAFWAVREIRPNDGPTRILQGRAEKYLRHPPDDDWTGVHEMTEK